MKSSKAYEECFVLDVLATVLIMFYFIIYLSFWSLCYEVIEYLPFVISTIYLSKCKFGGIFRLSYFNF